MILPVRKETIVLSESSEEVIQKIGYVTGKKRGGQVERPVLFVGNVGSGTFSITRHLSRPENFMPLIQGRFEETSNGCILFLRYTLQFSSRMFVVFWTVTTLLFAVFLWFIMSNAQLALTAMAVLILNVAFSHFNFHRQYKKARQALMEVINAA